MLKATVEAIQTRLQGMHLYIGGITGERNVATNISVASALDAREADLEQDFRPWSARRRTIAFLQLWCTDVGIDAGKIDGLWGPQTQYANDTLLEFLRTGKLPEPWRDEIDKPPKNTRWPRQKDIRAFYGPPGGINNAPHPPPPLIKVPCPWKLKIAWDLGKSRKFFWVHVKVADSLAEVLEKVHERYGTDEIERLDLNLFGGDYNARLMRGGTAMSTHSWGIAIDFHPLKNQLKWGRERAQFARPEYTDWWRIWEGEGWVSLGRRRNFDWMHVQAARLNSD